VARHERTANFTVSGGGPHGHGQNIKNSNNFMSLAHAPGSAGKSVKVATLSGEDHWLSRTETRVQVLKELDSFLKSNL
jgi:hypothetical protein